MTNTDSDKNGPGYARFFSLGFTFVFTIGALTAAGYFLDRLLGTLPLFLLAGLVLGFAGSLYRVYVVLKRISGH